VRLNVPIGLGLMAAALFDVDTATAEISDDVVRIAAAPWSNSDKRSCR
jgi:hypothetical protein